jgi:hypothetical protein
MTVAPHALVSAAERSLHLQIFFKSEDPELTPIAGPLIATEGQAAVEGSVGTGTPAVRGGVPRRR